MRLVWGHPTARVAVTASLDEGQGSHLADLVVTSANEPSSVCNVVAP